MRIITCTSYYGTGSSAITDILGEFSECTYLGNYEFRFVQDPNGLMDLKYNIIDNPHRHNTSNAIKNYIKFAKLLSGNFFRKGYSRYMGDEFWNATMDYVNEITQLKSDSWWHYDRINRGELFYMIDTLYYKFMKVIDPSSELSLLMLTHEKGYFTSIDKEEFMTCTRDYINRVINAANKANKEFVMVDQLLPPTNLNNYLDFFSDIKVFVVDRDPRDLFIREKVRKGGVVPSKDVKEFCQWFKITRARRKYEEYNPDKIMVINFEDLIYEYEDSVKKIAEFAGVNMCMHKNPRTKFIPEKSIRNSNLIMQYPEFAEQVRYIEKELQEYLYPFEKYK